MNMTNDEKVERGLNFSGNYNQNYPYSGICDYLSSYLTMAGNCLNNNTEIYCVILGREYSQKTSGNVTLTVEGRHYS